MAACCAYGAFIVGLFLRKYELITFSRLSDYEPDKEEDLGVDQDPALGFDKVEEYRVDGMTCASCATCIESKLLQRTGVKRVNTSFLLDRAVVLYNRLLVTPEAIRKDIEEAGFSASLANTGHAHKKGFVWNWGEAFCWSLLCTLPILALNALPLRFCPQRTRQLYSVILAGFVQFGFGLPFYRRAVMTLRANGVRHLPMEFAIAWSTSVAYAMTIYCYATGIPESYAATTAGLISVVSLGKHLETRSRTSVTATLKAFAEMVPSTAILRDSGLRIPGSMLRTDDMVDVAPGQRFPCDGILCPGEGCAVRLELDESYHTGETRPIIKEPGDVCLAGTTNSSLKPVVLQVLNNGESRVGLIVKAVLAAQDSKSDLQLVTERIASLIVPATLLLSFVTFLLWLPVGLFPAVSHMTAALVVMCPCALTMSTPMAVMIGSVVGGRNGIVIRNGARTLEMASRITTVVVDKTGTLTVGAMRITGFKVRGNWEERQWWQLIRAAEEDCEHWASEAICNYIQQADKGAKPVRDAYFYVPGRGVECLTNGITVMVGNMQHLQDGKVEDLEIAISDGDKLDATTNCIYIALNRRYAGYVTLKDQLRPEALLTVQELKSMGLKVYMLTGDREPVAAEVARMLEIEEYKAEQTPHDKLELVQRLEEQEVVAMVGDGINDAPALAGASVGIAPQRYSSSALGSADIVLVRSSIGQFVPALRLAKATFATVRANIWWTCLYNFATIPLAMGFGERWGIRLPPTAAGFLMMGSSLGVAFNSLQLDRELNGQSPRWQTYKIKDSWSRRLGSKG